MHRRAVMVVGSLLTIACGPPGVGVEGTSDATTGDGSTSNSTAESTTTESGDPSTTTESSDGPTFVPEDDDMRPFECDQWAQDCPEGEKCVPYGSTGGNWDAHKCVPLMGDQAPGEPCWYGGVVEATDDCDETSICWDVMLVDDEPVGVCTPFCTGSPDSPECPPASSCQIGGDSTLALCISSCDPLIQDCGSGLACFWANGDFNCIFTTQDIPAGEPCGFINDCAKGLGCVSADVLPACADAACCTPFCDVELGDAACEALLPGTACVPLFDERGPPEYVHIGMCMLPP